MTAWARLPIVCDALGNEISRPYCSFSTYWKNQFRGHAISVLVGDFLLRSHRPGLLDTPFLLRSG